MMFQKVLALAGFGALAVSCGAPPSEKRTAEATSSTARPLSIDAEHSFNERTSTEVQAVDAYRSGSLAARVAYDGTQQFVTWVDYRLRDRACIFGTRIALDGTIKDPLGILITCNVGEAPTGLGVLEGNFVFVNLNERVEVVRIAPTGTVIDTNPLDLGAFRFTYAAYPSITFNDHGFAVTQTAQSATGTLDLVAIQAIFSGGAVTATTSVVVPSMFRGSASLGSSNQAFLSAASHGAYLFAGTEILSDAGGGADQFESFAYRFDPTTQTLGQRVVFESGPVPEADVAKLSPEFLVGSDSGWLFSRGSRNGYAGLRHAAFSQAGALLGQVEAPTSRYVSAVVPWNNGYIASLLKRQPDLTERYCNELWDSNGTPNGPCVPVPADVVAPGTVCPTGNTLTYFDLAQFGNYQFGELLYSSLSTTTLLPSTPSKVVSQSGVSERSPAIAFDGKKYLAMWTSNPDFRKASTDLYAARINADGTTEAPVLVSAGHGGEPKLIFDGTSFFAVWSSNQPEDTDQYELRNYGVRISSSTESSVPTIGTPINLGAPDSLYGQKLAVTAVSSDDTNRFVVFGASDIRAVRVRIADDTLVDMSPVALGGAPSSGSAEPVVAFDGKRFLIAFTGAFESIHAHIYGISVEKGTIEATSAPFLLYNGNAQQVGVRVASDGADGFMLAWADIRGTAFNVKAQHLASDGTPDVDARTIWSGRTEAYGYFQRIAVSYINDGVGYLVVWNERDVDGFRASAARVTVDGKRIIDPAPFVISTLTQNPTGSVAAAAGESATALTLVERFDPSGDVSALRLYARVVHSGKLVGETCELNSECATLFCTDGVCCTSACNDGCGVCNATPGACTPKGTSAHCGSANQFVCGAEALQCITNCSTNADCASGACEGGGCVPFAPIVDSCKDDATLLTKEGAEVGCGDYKCVTNVCRTSCVSTDDCKSGLVCDFEARCTLPPIPLNEAGCAAGASGTRNSRTPGTFVFCLFALTLTLGRRLTRSRRNS